MSCGRAAALAALLAGLTLWEAFAGELPAVSDPWDVAVVALLLIPATFGVVWALLPLAPRRGLVQVALAFGAVAVVLSLAGLGALFNSTKIVTYALLGFAFLIAFEALSWVVLVALIVPWADIVSVAAGPTKVIVEEEPGFFDRVSISFRLPGEEASANLGPPDVIFLALFLATAQRYGLRVGATWAATTVLVSLTLVATYVLDAGGLPALPAVALGFLLPNADLLWRSWRGSRGQASA
jgi:hypothetical protein